jgi:hypothetical protein
VDEWNQKRRDLLNYLQNNLRANPSYMGLGIPMRTSSYILGYQPSSGGDSKPQKRNRTSSKGHMSRRNDNVKDNDSY